ncbi:hypothetical protein [Pseudonocardia sp.]|jgi:predicted lipoprotein with Yx(FWY)xxD motif|uniref:COG4315 family predicted lipoprotein n=1 Tax=Pseudonocardia sp. TaxID=60912 RepID=UPI002630BFA7|nr:hypothetical protein [Pseudonocardia sp.]MCW2718304.1 hypothetical protein [Pseudonocardia sp.]MDT7615238.1 hypothetical protein [Pseudonocardiales bacterium]
MMFKLMSVLVGNRAGRIRRLGPLVGLSGLMLAAACGTGASTASGGGYGAAAPATSAPVATATSVATVQTVTASGLGTILADGQGRSLYLFEADTGTTSTCTGGCAQVWPPVLSAAAAHAAGGAAAQLVSTTRRADGTEQLAYHGHPLYYYVGDRAAGDVHGQGLNQFGAGWYVLDPHGNKIDNG